MEYRVNCWICKCISAHHLFIVWIYPVNMCEDVNFAEFRSVYLLVFVQNHEMLFRQTGTWMLFEERLSIAFRSISSGFVWLTHESQIIPVLISNQLFLSTLRLIAIYQLSVHIYVMSQFSGIFIVYIRILLCNLVRYGVCCFYPFTKVNHSFNFIWLKWTFYWV